MPEPTPTNAPAPNPAPAPAPAPNQPPPAPAAAPNQSPPQAPPGPPGTAFEAALRTAFPDGVIPASGPMPTGLQPGAPQFAGPAATGVSGPPAATGPAATGVTGVSGPAAAGPATTGATGATGPSGPPTKEQLDAAAAAMTIAAGTAFKIVRTENAQLREQLEAEQAKTAEAERKAGEAVGNSKEAKDLKEKVERYEKELAIVNVEATEAFQTTIAKPIKTAEASLKQLASKYEVPMGDLRAAMAEPDAGKRSDALSELSAKFNRLDTAAFDRTITELEGLEQARTQALGSAAEQLAQSRAEQARLSADAAKSFQKDWEVSRDKALETLRADKTAIGVIFTPTGDEAFDTQVEQAIGQASSLDITKLSNQDIAANFYRASVLPLATRLISDQVATIETLNAEIARLRGSQPPIGDGVVPGQQGGPPAPASFKEAATRALDGVLPR